MFTIVGNVDGAVVPVHRKSYGSAHLGLIRRSEIPAVATGTRNTGNDRENSGSQIEPPHNRIVRVRDQQIAAKIKCETGGVIEFCGRREDVVSRGPRLAAD